jgi:hypothetical protein
MNSCANNPIEKVDIYNEKCKAHPLSEYVERMSSIDKNPMVHLVRGVKLLSAITQNNSTLQFGTLDGNGGFSWLLESQGDGIGYYVEAELRRVKYSNGKGRESMPVRTYQGLHLGW